MPSSSNGTVTCWKRSRRSAPVLKPSGRFLAAVSGVRYGNGHRTAVRFDRVSSLKALGTVAVLVATAVGTWALARATVEPAVTPAVVPAPMAVPVERRILETAVIDRASVRYANPVTVPLLSVGDSVVTWSAATDSTVETGDVLVELSGRPAFVLEGATPMYRRLE